MGLKVLPDSKVLEIKLPGCILGAIVGGKKKLSHQRALGQMPAGHDPCLCRPWVSQVNLP